MAGSKKKLLVVEHSGEQHSTEVENFDALKLHKEIKEAQGNSTNDFVVVIGDVIIDSRSIKKVVPAE